MRRSAVKRVAWLCGCGTLLCACADDAPRSGPACSSASFVVREVTADALKRSVGGHCLPRALEPDAQGQVPCVVAEARRVDGACNCDAPRRPIGDAHRGVMGVLLESPWAETSNWNCFCEVDQLQGDELAACQQQLMEAPQLAGVPVSGWCYIDANVAPPIGDPAIVASCPGAEKRLLRFVGDATPPPNTTRVIVCEQGSHCSE